MPRRNRHRSPAPLAFVALAQIGLGREARADDRPTTRVTLAVAPVAVGMFTPGTDGHDETSRTAFGARLGVMFAAGRYFQVGGDGMVLAPYGGIVVYSAAQLAARASLPLADRFEIGVTGRFGVGFGRVESGIAYRITATPHYPPGPAVDYRGWQGGLAFDATMWTSQSAALFLAVEGIAADEPSRAGSDVYLSYLANGLAPAALATWLGVQVGL